MKKLVGGLIVVLLAIAVCAEEQTEEEVTLETMPTVERRADSSLEVWEPPRLVDGVWVTGGVSDEKAKEYAAEDNVGKSEREVRDGEWAAHWKAYWREVGAPEWAGRRGREIEAEQERQTQARYNQWQQSFTWGAPGISDWDLIQWRLDATDPKSGDWWRRFGEISDLDLPRSWDFMYDLNDIIFDLDLLNEKLERGWPW